VTPGWFIGGPFGPTCLRPVRSKLRAAAIQPEVATAILAIAAFTLFTLKTQGVRRAVLRFRRLASSS